LAATGKSIWFELSSEFTRWKQRLDAKNAASTGMKPVESLDPYLQRSSCQLSPHWHKASGSETQGKIHYRVSEWALASVATRLEMKPHVWLTWSTASGPAD
jgi:hypothetical protein